MYTTLTTVLSQCGKAVRVRWPGGDHTAVHLALDFLFVALRGMHIVWTNATTAVVFVVRRFSI
ncbi:hypothetical protein FIBSPDRAFT_877930 [Athelia psychrophila]|uniref:Uncharacterized protein n=1 Tax=Athelia psychrophila TaxID=1759441 RepID=A0A167VII7_9AGAM|nr:hypothetical protein FIBSPDRAFT_877930 [Fibularhizoctonia sp. CBS 109695]